ncbi:MAG: amidohydrolase family protein [Bryobacteraceae bacterium]
MKCSGKDPSTGEFVEIRYDSLISGVDTLLDEPETGVFVAPGWIDLQVNGYAGVDYNSPLTPPDEIARSIEMLHSTGTSRFFPTVITGSPTGMLESLRNLARAKSNLRSGAAMEAFHVEGPHISAEEGPRGAHPEQWVRPPDIDEYRSWQAATDGQVRPLLSPRGPQAPRYIEQLVSDGVTVSIGHTKADALQLQAAVSAGATMSTHIGNGAHQLLQRHPNYIWEQLAEDKLTASFIVDGIHLGQAFLRAALRAKTITRSVLVTDASMPAMATPGIYRLGDQDVELTDDGRVVLAGQTRLAGSALRMDDAISNIMRFTGINLTEALAMATRNPARVARVSGRLRGLVPGERADLVRFRFNETAKRIEVLETIAAGQTVYKAL